MAGVVANRREWPCTLASLLVKLIKERWASGLKCLRGYESVRRGAAGESQDRGGIVRLGRLSEDCQLFARREWRYRFSAVFITFQSKNYDICLGKNC